MKIFVIGGTGFLGQYLCRALSAEGHGLTILARSVTDTESFGKTVRIIRGDPTRQGGWQEFLVGHDTVINLAGASIFKLWTRRVRKEILESRVVSTQNIVNILKEIGDRNIQFLNASGIGYYGYCGDDIIDEGSPAGNTFLASVAQSWESAARQAEVTGIRVVQCRFGIILGRNGGAFSHMLPLFRFRLGATWGRGEQWFSWIHEEDVVRAISFLLERKEIRGPVNFTAPNPVTNLEMTQTLNNLLRKGPYIKKMPKWFFRLIFGELSGVFLEGQKVLPRVLQQNDFTFQFHTFDEAVRDLIPICFQK